MERTASIFPKSDELKRKLRIPLSVAMTLPVNSKNQLFFENQEIQSDLYICSKCKSYISPNSSRNGSIWRCSICGTQNQSNNDKIFEALTRSEESSIILKKTLLSSNDKINGQYFAIYFSLNFPALDFIKAKCAAFSLLRHLPKNSKCLFIIGTDSSDFSILLPPNNFENGIPSKYSVAAAVRFSSFQDIVGLDLNRFFFRSDESSKDFSDNIAAAEAAVDKLAPTQDSNPHQKAINLAKILCGFISPLRFIAIINEVTRSLVDLDPILQEFCRIDILVSSLTSRAIELSKTLPGMVSVLSIHNPAEQARHLINQKTRYKVISRCHLSGGNVKWFKPLRPYTDLYENAIYAPVLCNAFHPFSFEIVPDYKKDEIVCQVVTKYFVVKRNEKRFVLNVKNVCIKTTSDFDTYLSGINWNTVLWFWYQKVAGMMHDEANAAIFRVAAIVVKQCGGLNNEEGENKTKVDEGFVKGICSFPHAKAFCNVPEDAFNSTNLLLFSPPTKLKMIPEIEMESDQNNKVCFSMNGISETRNNANIVSKTAKQKLKELPVYAPITSPIEHDFIRMSTAYTAIIEKLISKGM